MTTGRARMLLGLAVAGAAWFAAFAIESGTRLMYSTYYRLGADLPAFSSLTVGAVQAYVPWLVAAVFTAALVIFWRSADAYFLHACAVVACVTAVGASFAAISLALPTRTCGGILPAWPAADSGSASPVSCGR